jgi:hypothetical protein
MAGKPVLELESIAVERAATELEEPLKHANRVLDLISMVSRNDEGGPLSKGKLVRTLLLHRMQNDLRCCLILAERGYPLQAASLAAGICEAWATIAAIKDDEAAHRWLIHEKETQSFDSAKSLIREALQTMLGNREACDRLYAQYQQLCMPKHLNPMVERERGYELEGNEVRFQPGPNLGPKATATAWFALERATRFTFFGILAFIHNDGSATDRLQKMLELTKSEIESLQALSAKSGLKTISRRSELLSWCWSIVLVRTQRILKNHW